MTVELHVCWVHTCSNTSVSELSTVRLSLWLVSRIHRIIYAATALSGLTSIGQSTWLWLVTHHNYGNPRPRRAWKGASEILRFTSKRTLHCMVTLKNLKVYLIMSKAIAKRRLRLFEFYLQHKRATVNQLKLVIL